MKSAVFFLLLLGTLLVALFLGKDKIFLREPLPKINQVSAFTLSEAQGRSFSSTDLKGKIWLVNFFFTRCKGICPTVTAELRKLFREYEDSSGSSPLPDSERIELVSISVDPEHDTVPVLEEYAARFGITSPRWHFLTGEKDRIKEISVKDFYLGSFDDPSIHSDRIVLIDKELTVRGYYKGTEEEDLQLLRTDIERLSH